MHKISKWERFSGLLRLAPFFLALATTESVTAQTLQQRAELDRLSAAGYEAYVDGDYQRALSAMEAAFALIRSAWSEDDPLALTIMHNLATLYDAAGRYAEAEALFLSALEHRERVLGKEHPDTLMTVNSLAALYDDVGRYAEAESLYFRALEGFERVLGKDHPHTLNSVNNVALLYSATDRSAEAELLFLRALEGRERVLGKDHPDTLGSVNNLAHLYHTTNRHTEAELLYQRVLEGLGRVLGKEHPQTLTIMNNLAGLYSDTDRHAEAEALHLRALHGRERVLGKDHPDTLVSVANLAAIYHATARFAEAELLYRRTLGGNELVLGKDHPETLNSVNRLAELLSVLGRHAEAEALYLRALDGRERILGKEHPATLESMIKLAFVYEGMGHYAEAEPLLQRALTVQERVLGKEHPRTVNSVSYLGSLYQSMGRFADAERLLMRTLEGKERVWGKRHPDTLLSVDDLAALYYDTGRYAEAELLLNRTLEGLERELGKDHTQTLAHLKQRALLYETTGRYAEAKKLLLRVLEVEERVWGKHHPNTLLSVNNLASLYLAMGHYDKAEPLFLRAIDDSEQVLGKSHPDTLLSVNNLAVLYLTTGRYADAEPLFIRALESRERVMGQDHPETLTSVNNLAGLYQNTGRSPQAEALYLRALDVRERALGQEHPLTLLSLHNLSLLRLSLGDQSSVADAIAALQQGLQRQTRRVIEQIHAGAGEGLRAQFATDSSLRDLALSAALAFTDHAELGARALLLTKGTAGETDAALSRLSTIDPRPAVNEAAQALRQAEGELFSAQQSGDAAIIQSARNARDAARQALFRLIDPPLVFQPELISPMSIADALTDGQVFLDYGIYHPVNFASREAQEAHVMLAAYRPDRPPALFDLGPANALRGAILTLSDMTANLEAPLEGAQNLLSDALLGPVADLLAEADEAIIAPDGVLARINFAMLLDPQDTDLHLSERLPLRILPSGRSLLEQPEPASAARSLFLGAALQDYGPYDKDKCKSTNLGDTRDGLCPLPNAVSEVEEISALFNARGEAHTLLHDQATEDAIRRDMPSARFVHLATHGGLRLPGLTGSGGGLNNVGLAFHRPFVDSDMQSLVPSNDGVLTGAEAARLQLWGTDLVVLSACDTALGEDAGAEGTWSMAHGFRLAGVRAVMMTLWKVNDDTAPHFMKRFYQTMLERRQTAPDEQITTTLRTALRDTRLWAIDEGWNYWDYAPFVLVEN